MNSSVHALGHCELASTAYSPLPPLSSKSLDKARHERGTVARAVVLQSCEVACSSCRASQKMICAGRAQGSKAELSAQLSVHRFGNCYPYAFRALS